MNAIYCRVSTDEQARKGYSLEDQRQACRLHLLKMGLHDIEEYIDDGYSGEYLERPALEKLRSDIQLYNITYIAIYDPDRLSRNLTNQLILADEIEKSGTRLTFVTGDYDCSPEGRLFFSMKGAISAYEKAKIRERTYRGRRAKAAKGKIISNARPFGYDWDKKSSMYIINEREAQVIKAIYRMCLNNGWSARTIALELARKGILGRNKRPLSVSTISRILSKEMYFGNHYLFKQSVRKTGQNTREIVNNPRDLWIPINIPPIVSKDLWDKVQQQLQMNKRLAKRNTKHDYLLKGLLICGVCGRKMTASSRKGPRKNVPDKAYYYYSCISKESKSYKHNHIKCSGRRIPANDLDALVWNSLESIIAKDQKFLGYINNRDDDEIEIKALKNSYQKLQNQQTDITNWYRLGLLNSQAAKTELETISKDKDEIAAKINNLLEQQKITNQPVFTPTDYFKFASIEHKRLILQRIPYKIMAARLEDDFEFWLQEY
ncbi:MAG: recombinase family protein [Veillonellaceae bacterium]|jgi:site-specific DNA recombinase|nr:recombinase family protein [Veillonellaceae bacterium]